MSHRSIRVTESGIKTYSKRQFLLDHPDCDELVIQNGRYEVARPTSQSFDFHSKEGSLMVSVWAPGTRSKEDSGLVENWTESTVTFWIGLGGKDPHTITRPISEIKWLWTTGKSKTEMIHLHHAFNQAVKNLLK